MTSDQSVALAHFCASITRALSTASRYDLILVTLGNLLGIATPNMMSEDVSLYTVPGFEARFVLCTIAHIGAIRAIYTLLEGLP